MLDLEEMGWFHTFSYKRTQGLTDAAVHASSAFCSSAWSGVWSLMSHNIAPAHGDLADPIPFIDKSVVPQPC